MAKQRHSPAYWLNRKDYEAMKDVAANHANLPDTFDEWEKQSNKMIAEEQARGVIVEKMIVDPHKFAEWCLKSGVKPDLTSLNAYAVVLYREQSERHA